MPLYEYRSDDGEVIEQYAPLADYEKPVIRDGKVFRRILSVPRTKPVIQYPIVSHTLPKWGRGAPHTSKGNMVITSQRHERELCAKYQMARDYDRLDAHD